MSKYKKRLKIKNVIFLKYWIIFMEQIAKYRVFKVESSLKNQTFSL